MKIVLALSQYGPHATKENIIQLGTTAGIVVTLVLEASPEGFWDIEF